MNSRLLKRVILAGIFLSAAMLEAATVMWTGGAGDSNWSSAANWSTGSVPAAGDDIFIHNATVNWDINGGLPGNCTINLSGSAILNTLSVIRASACTFNVGNPATLSGGFWDLDNGTFVFEAGSSATMPNWEQKGQNSFTFDLNSSGFTPLTPGTLRFGGGATIANATYIADMQDYEGDTGIITLVDFSNATLTDAEFQTATLNVLNAGNYTANLQWNETSKSIELNITDLRRLDLILYQTP
ncbi:MAG: hypothetical protein JEZ10_05895 [Verrucomicrobia bacterium]|nr:hypothetical protein [Verrucomicrobiota bacterium]